jgi:hypothetical protein
MLGGWGLSCERRGDRWSLAYDSLGTHPDLAAAIESFDSTFSSRRFTGDAETHLQWLAALEETSLAERLRAELLMQARIKFEAECAAWLFTDVDREQAGWRREVSGLTPIRRRIAASGWMVAGPLKCDVARFGLTAALRDADRLAQYWRDFDVACRREREAGRSAPSQPDLFFGAPRGVGPGGSLDDGINFVLSEALRVEGAPPEEEFGVAVVMLLKALAWIGRCDWPFFGVDTVDRVFEVER